MYNLVVKFTETENVITINQMDESPMRFLSSRVRFTQGFFFLAVPKIDSERIVQRWYYVTPSHYFK